MSNSENSRLELLYPLHKPKPRGHQNLLCVSVPEWRVLHGSARLLVGVSQAEQRGLIEVPGHDLHPDGQAFV